MKHGINQIISMPLQTIFYLFMGGISVGLLTTPYWQLAILPGVGLLFFLLLFRYPQTGLYLMLFLIPYGGYRKLQIEGLPIINIPWLIAMLLLVIIVSRFLAIKQIPENLKSNLWLYFLIFAAVSFISALLSPFIETAFLNIFLLLASYIFIALCFMLISEEAFKKTVPAILIWSVSIGSMLAVIGFLFKLQMFAVNVQSAQARGIGGSIDPNNMSLMIIFVLPLLIHWIFYSPNRLLRVTAILLVIVNLMALIFTYSRGGALVFAVSFALFCLERLRKFRPKYLGWVLLALVFGLVTVMISVPASYWERQMTISKGASADRAMGRRVSYLYVGAKAFKEHPVLGSGPGVFREIFAGSPYAALFEVDGATKRRFAHNTYLEVLVGTGFVGFIVFLAMVWRALKNFYEAQKCYSERDDLEMSSLVSSYRFAFVTVLLYLFIYSDLQHKYLLLSLALSQVALDLARSAPE